MINSVVKYLSGELTHEEKKFFLLSVTDDKTQGDDLIEFDHLLGYLSLMPQKEDTIKAQKSLLNFLKEVDTKKESE
jgi:hypothetical protein